MVGLLLADQLQVWHIYLILSIRSIFVSFQWPAYCAAVMLIAPKQHLGRASGMVQLSEAASMILSPAIGGLLFLTINLWGVIPIAVASYLFSIIILLFICIPKPEPGTADARPSSSLLKGALFSWKYIMAQLGLVALLAFISITNVTLRIVQILVTPLALTITPPYEVRYQIPGGSSQVLWQSNVPPSMQGRVFAVRRVIAWAALPLAFLVAGPLAEYVFAPLLAPNGPLTNNIGSLMGAGPGPGIRLLFMVMSVLTILAFIGGYRYSHLRLLEDETPAAVPGRSWAGGMTSTTTHAF